MTHSARRKGAAPHYRGRRARAQLLSVVGLTMLVLATACTSASSGPIAVTSSIPASAAAAVVNSAAAVVNSGATATSADAPPAAGSVPMATVTGSAPPPATATAAATEGVGPRQSATIGRLPSAAQAVMSEPAYRSARWNYLFRDATTKQVLMAFRPQEFVFTASTAKEFTIGSAYATMGPNSTVSTPVYTTTAPVNGVVAGKLVLVASGDLAMGGRGALEGRVDQAFTATAIDHVYGDLAPNAAFVKDDPLAGLDSLARQVAAKGITTIAGGVSIDTRVWETYHGGEGPVPSIFLNDNVLDLTVTAAASAGPVATVALHPQTRAFAVQSKVTTVAKGVATSLQVGVSPTDPHALVITGTIAAGHSQLTIYRIPDAASWARTLFIEALKRAGVSVGAPLLGTNTEVGLPARNSYPAGRKVASINSAPLHAYGSMILETSYNTGANAILCSMAVKIGSADCLDGLKTVRQQIIKAGLDTKDVMLWDGQGVDPASTTSTQMVDWLTWARTQPWAKVFEAGQPVQGETGTLAAVLTDSPAKGMIRAKTGTSAAGVPVTDRIFYQVQSLAGYMTTKSGREVEFDVSMSGGTYPDLPTALVQASTDVSTVAAAFQQAM